MKTLLNIFCTIILLCLFSTCRNINCPDFDEDVLSWYPYEEGSVIHLESKTTDTLLTIPIVNVMVSHTSHYNTGSKCEGGCNDEIQIDSRAGFSISVYLEKNKIKSEHYNVNGESFYENAIISDNYTFNGKEYEQVKIFEKAKSHSKLIVARNFGIVGFIDKDGNEWLLLENSVRPQVKPNIISSGCGEP